MWGRAARTSFPSFRWCIHSFSSWVCAWQRWITDSSSARQRVTKRGVGQARHLDGKLLWIQNCKDFIQYGTSTYRQQHGRHRHLEARGLDFWWTLLGIGARKGWWTWEKGVRREKELCTQGQQNCQDDCQNRYFRGLAANGYRSYYLHERNWPVHGGSWRRQ